MALKLWCSLELGNLINMQISEPSSGFLANDSKPLIFFKWSIKVTISTLTDSDDDISGLNG